MYNIEVLKYCTILKSKYNDKIKQMYNNIYLLFVIMCTYKYYTLITCFTEFIVSINV